MYNHKGARLPAQQDPILPLFFSLPEPLFLQFGMLTLIYVAHSLWGAPQLFSTDLSIDIGTSVITKINRRGRPVHRAFGNPPFMSLFHFGIKPCMAFSGLSTLHHFLPISFSSPSLYPQISNPLPLSLLYCFPGLFYFFLAFITFMCAFMGEIRPGSTG